MSRNTKQTDLARHIEATLPRHRGKASKYLQIYLGLRDRTNAILKEIEELKKQEASDKINALCKEKEIIGKDLNYYGQKLIAAGINLDAPDTEMIQQATIIDNMKIIAEIVDSLEGKGKPNPEGRPKQKQAYGKCISGTNMVSKATKQLCEEDLADYGLPTDAKQVQGMQRGIIERRKNVQKAKKRYRCRDEAKKSLKAGYKAEQDNFLADFEQEETANNEVASTDQKSEPLATAQTSCYNEQDDREFFEKAFGIVS